MCQIFIGKRRGGYSSICVEIFIGERRAGYSSICVIFSRGVAAAYAAPYVSNFIGEHNVPYVLFSIGERRGVCSSICVIFYQGAAVCDPYVSKFSSGNITSHMCQILIEERLRRMQLHMCQISIGKRRGV